MPFQMIREDITRVKADVIVNAANTRLMPGGGVCGAIFQAAGYSELAAACAKIGSCPTGSSVITPGFRLCKYVIHTAGPVWQGGTHGEAEQLASCYRTALQLAAENEVQSIAFPLISAGIYGYPLEEALRIGCDTIRSWLLRDDAPDLTVWLVLYGRQAFRAGSRLYGQIAGYIDEHSPRFMEFERRQAARRARFSQ